MLLTLPTIAGTAHTPVARTTRSDTNVVPCNEQVEHIFTFLAATVTWTSIVTRTDCIRPTGDTA